MANLNADLVPSQLIGTEIAPTEDQLWNLPDAFLVNWERGLIVRTAWRTDVVRSRNVSEVRRGLVGRPFRTFGYQFTAMNRGDSAKLETMLSRMGNARTLLPLYPDHTKITAAASITDRTLTADLTDRRFFIGGRALLVQTTPGGPCEATFATFEVVQIQRIDESAGTLLIATGLVNPFPSGTRLYPLTEVKVLLSHSYIAMSDHHIALSLQAIETEGYTALPTLAEAGVTPSGFTDYLGLPIFDDPFDFQDVRLSIRRDGQYSLSGWGNIVELKGSRPRYNFDVPFLEVNRANAFKLLRFFDSRAGSLHPFWMLSPLTQYELIAITTTTITVKIIGPEIDWDFRPFVGIKLRDGTTFIREIASTTRVGPNDVITISDPLPSLTLAQVQKATLAIKARFQMDEIVETWVTNEIMRTRLQITDLLEEKDVTLTDLESIETVTDGLPSGDPSLGCASRWVRLQGEQNNPGFQDVDVYFPEVEFFILRDVTNIPPSFPTPFFFLWNGGRYRINTDGAGEIVDNSIVDRVPEDGIAIRTEDCDFINLGDFLIPTALQEAASPCDELPPLVRIKTVLHKPAFDWDEACGVSPLDTPANAPPNDFFPWPEVLELFDNAPPTNEVAYQAFVNPPRYVTPIVPGSGGFPSTEHPAFEIFNDLLNRIDMPVTTATDPVTGFTVEYEAWSKWFADATIKSVFWTNVEDEAGRLLSKHVWELRILLYTGSAGSPTPTYIAWIGRKFGLHPFGRYDLIDETTYENIVLGLEGFDGVHNCALVNIGATLVVCPETELSPLFGNCSGIS